MKKASKIRVKHAHIIKLTKTEHSSRGSLYYGEYGKHLPFNVKRIFFISDVKSRKAVRANHAHKNVNEVIFCINGSVDVHLDDGVDKQKIVLDNPRHGIYLEPQVWRKLTNFSKDSIVIGLAKDLFDSQDYITDYQNFLKQV